MSVSSQAADVPRANFADFKTSVEFASPITTICGTRRSGVSGVSALSHRIENVRERASERASAPLIRIDRFNQAKIFSLNTYPRPSRRSRLQSARRRRERGTRPQGARRTSWHSESSFCSDAVTDLCQNFRRAAFRALQNFPSRFFPTLSSTVTVSLGRSNEGRRACGAVALARGIINFHCVHDASARQRRRARPSYYYYYPSGQRTGYECRS